MNSSQIPTTTSTVSEDPRTRRIKELLAKKSSAPKLTGVDLTEYVSLVLEGTPRIGSQWEHYRGGLYKIDVVAIDSETLEVRVVYTSLDTSVTWDRPLSSWNMLVLQGGQWMARFRPVQQTGE